MKRPLTGPRGLLLPAGSGWSTPAVVITSLTAILVVVGLLMSFSAAFVNDAEAGRPFDTFLRQLLWAGIGAALFAVAASLRMRAWRALSWVLIVLSGAGLVAVLLPSVGVEVYGSTRWIALGPVRVQPSEIAKLATLLWLSDVLTRKQEQKIDLAARLDHLMVPAVPLLLAEALLVMLQPDLGTTLLLAGTVLLVLFHKGLPYRWLVVGGGVAAAAGAVLAMSASYRMGRIQGWLNPSSDPDGNGFQLLQSLYALGNGGVSGTGIGQGRGKWNFIPNPDTDFVFAVVGEEVGLVGALSVLALFALLLRFGFEVSRQAKDQFASTAAFTATALIVGQALLNVCTVIGLLPITGVTLPLVSKGGSSLATTVVMVGLVVSAAREQAAR